MCLSSYAQSSIDVFNKYIKDGDKHIREKKFDDAIERYEKAAGWCNKWNLPKVNLEAATAKIEAAKKEKTVYIKSQKEEQKIKSGKTDINFIVINANEAKKSIKEELKLAYKGFGKLLIENQKFKEAKDIYTKLFAYDKLAQYDIKWLEYKLNNNTAEQELSKVNDYDNLLNLLDKSLENKDTIFAALIRNKMFEKFKEPFVKDEVSILYSKRTGNSHFKEFFLSDLSQLNANRDYYTYSKPKPSDDKSLFEYYINLVTLDEAYLKTNPVDADVVKEQLSKHYNNAGWFAILTKKFNHLTDYFNKSITASDNKTAQGNLPHALLLNGKFQEAKAKYIALKDQDFEAFSDYPTFKDAFLSDFEEFRKKSVIEPGSDFYNQISEIEKLLKQ